VRHGRGGFTTTRLRQVGEDGVGEGVPVEEQERGLEMKSPQAIQSFPEAQV